jgi:hypothetical protein
MRLLFLASVTMMTLSWLPAAGQLRIPNDRFGEAAAQSPVPTSRLPDTRQGETAASSAGRTGQRRTREQVSAQIGVEPMGRIANRIQNRAQTRIRNRIDRYYDPQANVISPFVVASEQARAASRRGR